MKKLLTLLALISSLACFSQSETHDFITYDSTISIFTPPWGPTNTWMIRVSRPRNYFTRNHPDTATRPAIIFMPGQGQLGSTDTTHFHEYGPHYWIQHGWDGGVQLGNGKHYPILITVLYTNGVTTYAPDVLNIADTIIKAFHLKPKGRHFTGFSEGAFSWGGMICYEKSAGSEDGMSIVTSLTALEGTPDPAVNSWDRRQGAYKVWAAKYGGKYFYLEGNGSDNFRNGYLWSQPMNDTVPNSAYFSWESLGGGAHCCWNSMYDPSATNWNCVTPPALGPNNATGPAPNTMGTYRIGQNLFTWMIAQGDTTLVGSTPCNPTVNAGGDFNITLPANQVTQTGNAFSQCGNTITSTIWSQISGPGNATLSTPNNITCTFSNLIQGTYDFRLTAIDNTGSSSIDDFLVVVNPVGRTCRVFNWDITNGNVNVTNANIVPAGQPALHGCDLVIVDNKSGATPTYRSFSMSNIGNIADSQDIVIQFINQAGITPSTSAIQANTMDSCNHVRVKGLNMSNASDAVMTKWATLGHSHFITWDSCIFKNTPGMFPSSIPNYPSLAKLDTTNQYDTINVNYKWRWHNCRFDSISFNGLTAIWWNGAVTNPSLAQVWLLPEVDSCYFSSYASTANPSTYINATMTFGAKIHDNTFRNLGVAPPYVGHAAIIFTKYSNMYVYRNHFGDHNFGNDYRDRGTGTLKQFDWLMYREIPGYNKRSWYCFNYIDHKVKYPSAEIGVNPGDSTSLTWYSPQYSAMVFNNTFFRPGMGLRYDPYHNSLVDSYGASWDHVFVKNNVEIGPNTDTTAWNFTTSGSAGPAVSGQLITYTNGAVGARDTASNLITGVWLTSMYTDSVSWQPTLNGILYNQGVSTGIPISKGITDQDFFHNPYPTIGRGSIGKGQGIDIGAFQLIQPLILNSLYFQIHTTVIGPL